MKSGDRERDREIGSLPLKSGELKPFANLVYYGLKKYCVSKCNQFMFNECPSIVGFYASVKNESKETRCKRCLLASLYHRKTIH